MKTISNTICIYICITIDATGLVFLKRPQGKEKAYKASSTFMNLFYISLIIIDEDPERTLDLTLAPQIDYNNYNINMPIRPY